ncbi:hypothetical protein BaRGS_00005600 [Batillaria attramentaria]|uniref:Uncharacterized protein n=1 Tax=Batillaria attramentaria TaxID=370345 RepID=A0ABD0LVC3_9CAEN
MASVLSPRASSGPLRSAGAAGCRNLILGAARTCLKRKDSLLPVSRMIQLGVCRSDPGQDALVSLRAGKDIGERTPSNGHHSLCY